ncbi:membrane protein insertion efficiency factor YidD [Draconibacterium orientale]|jgi:putative component of membrane protein insertase Oxa1/YidC/SpoIIIJ protein YidD|uniref:membrane protein insertion efficiency factor YidD n=1 Tax=Draconibacterium orientale TaxID=1168034 RepID=UPI002A0A6BD5|nr:membrane protein insertion efficiency factor YidD [Draconibacterium orientale]
MQKQYQKANRTVFLLLVFVFASFGAYSQQIDLKSDLLLVDSVAEQQMPATGHRPYIYKNQPKTFKNSNPVSLVYGGSLYVYQNLFSQHLSASCLYHPSCSDFSKQAVSDYGLIKGTLLSFDRLSRCNRIAATDLDPGTIDPHVHRFHDAIKKYK